MLSVAASRIGAWFWIDDVTDYHDLQWLYNFYYHVEYPISHIGFLVMDFRSYYN